MKISIVASFLGLTTVMLIYGVGIGSANSTACRQTYAYSVERYGYNCRLIGFPTAYVENDVWGHNAHVYPGEFAFNLLLWSVVFLGPLSLLGNSLRQFFDAISRTNSAIRLAMLVELIAGPLIALIFLNDLPGRQRDVLDRFFTVHRWTVLYVPIPLVTVLGILCGGIGVVQALRTGRERGAVLCLPFVLAAWNVIALFFVGVIPEIV
ncbi:MAG: hypothetical protein ABI051_03530 [Vicinamibacterales bacterium]